MIHTFFSMNHTFIKYESNLSMKPRFSRDSLAKIVKKNLFGKIFFFAKILINSHLLIYAKKIIKNHLRCIA
jgi:hypothetical protein